MTLAIVTPIALLLGLLGGYVVARRRRHLAGRGAGPIRRILLPFTGTSISRRALDAAVRLAGAEGATLVPAYLAPVPMHLPFDAVIAGQCETALPLLEAIEQRAVGQEVRVESRIERGRSYRDALRRLLAEEPFDRVIISATSNDHDGFSAEDIVWLLERAPAEVLILRPDPRDERTVG